MFPLESIPKSFKVQMVKCSNLFVDLQTKTINENLRLFSIHFSDYKVKLEEMQEMCAEEYLERCDIHRGPFIHRLYSFKEQIVTNSYDKHHRNGKMLRFQVLGETFENLVKSKSMPWKDIILDIERRLDELVCAPKERKLDDQEYDIVPKGVKRKLDDQECGIMPKDKKRKLDDQEHGIIPKDKKRKLDDQECGIILKDEKRMMPKDKKRKLDDQEGGIIPKDEKRKLVDQEHGIIPKDDEKDKKRKLDDQECGIMPKDEKRKLVDQECGIIQKDRKRKLDDQEHGIIPKDKKRMMLKDKKRKLVDQEHGIIPKDEKRKLVDQECGIIQKDRKRKLDDQEHGIIPKDEMRKLDDQEHGIIPTVRKRKVDDQEWYFIPKKVLDPMKFKVGRNWLLTGKKVHQIQNSKFCNPMLIDLWNKVSYRTEINIQNHMPTSHYYWDIDLADLLLKGIQNDEVKLPQENRIIYINSICWVDSLNQELKIKQDFTEVLCKAIKIMKPGNSLIICIQSLLTRYMAGIIFMLLSLFEKCLCLLPNDDAPASCGQMWILKNFRKSPYTSRVIHYLESIIHFNNHHPPEEIEILETVPVETLCDNKFKFYEYLLELNNNNIQRRLSSLISVEKEIVIGI
ncbi:cap-specific mRNA [Caerostris extrusa]|uniref:Cap-specific mRNA n=1 Tax=Caerostris extrusa TaxID=172846 RepID=A0AAV4YDD5_CAEEX|nr:cap-specific mRNA [Caerostris extrusa]